MLLGYARVSKGEEQDTRMQEAALRAAGVERTFTERAERPSRQSHCPEAMDAQHGRNGGSHRARTQHANPLLGHRGPPRGIWALAQVRCETRSALTPSAPQGTSGVRFYSHQGPRV
jgi:hypothetical protein